MDDHTEAVRSRIRAAAALLLAIDAGELLSALPAESGDRQRHQAGAALLELALRELHAAERALAG